MGHPTEQEIVGELRAAGCVFAEDEARVLMETPPDARGALLARRVAGEPLEHVVGWVEFAGARLHVAPGVFVPRRRTEALVRVALPHAEGAVVLEMCCGVGAVAHAIADRTRPRDVIAVDIDPAATDCARRNLPHADVVTGDLFEPLPTALQGTVDVLVANAPYVPTGAVGTMPREARDHEPVVALDGGPDGLDIARRIVEQAPSWLSPGGILAIETSAGQAPSLAALMTAQGLAAEIVVDDDVDGLVVVGLLVGAAVHPENKPTAATVEPGTPARPTVGTDTEASTP
ncbi:putative protein N(5)-glutamine methyltransferase [Williamsia deligens]|uniref:Methyltransferase domain-containing protein n=1 Tax=Williamsia deligens TaxID=321325 RepID=A0ABW3G661_9NOCA|nr:putative protein N(5)-glutamine methyltransferase [Williamsia deligens]MCP2193682.1 release factor glutamine methyltransferase [Williamsia deligens]